MLRDAQVLDLWVTGQLLDSTLLQPAVLRTRHRQDELGAAAAAAAKTAAESLRQQEAAAEAAARSRRLQPREDAALRMTPPGKMQRVTIGASVDGMGGVQRFSAELHDQYGSAGARCVLCSRCMSARCMMQDRHGRLITQSEAGQTKQG